MLNEKLLIATLKAIAENNYAIEQSTIASEITRSKAIVEYLSYSNVINMLEDEKYLTAMAEIYRVEV